jgi:ABC-2 type transport system ATP-binding protein
MAILEVQNLTKIYPLAFKALSKVNLKVEDNSFLALLGKNGAGKSTFINIISSLTNKTSGKVFIDGKDLDTDRNSIKRILGLVPQEINLSIFENPLQILINQAGYFGIKPSIARERAIKYLKLLDLWNKRNSQVVTLSGGMKRRLMIARALMHDPKILFLDEPTAGVDIEVRYKIWDVLLDLKKHGKTIILTTHYLEEAERLCDSIAIIDEGEIKFQGLMHSVLLQKSYYTIIVLPRTKQKDLKKIIANISSEYKINEDSTIEINIDHSKKTIGQALEEIVNCGLIVQSVKQEQTAIERLFNSITSKEPKK